MRALAEANAGDHAPAYGGDGATQLRLARLVRRHFGAHAVAFPVFGGTGANVVALLAACPRHAAAVICAESSHCHCDEGGAPEAVAGLKLHSLRTQRADGKLTPELVQSALFDRDSVHRAQAGCVSIAQTTEMGAVYSPAEVRALADHAHAHGMLLHLDGARISNAAAALGLPLRAFTTDAGVDILSFGGTKVGAMSAEAVIVLNEALLPALPFLRKTNMQLASKQRFMSAQLVALLEAADGSESGAAGAAAAGAAAAAAAAADGREDAGAEEEGGGAGAAPAAPAPVPLCVRAAAHANAMAARLLAGVRAIPGVHLPPEDGPLANAIFPTMPPRVTARLLAQGWRFYVWVAATGTVRFMTAWDQ